MLPAIEYLTPDADVLFLSIESSDSRMVGFGAFEHSNGNNLLPLPHLTTYRTQHTFMDGLLLDQDYARQALEALFEYLSEQNRRWHGIHFDCRSADSVQSWLMEEVAAEFDAEWHTDHEHERGVLVPSRVNDEYMQELYSRNRRKTLQRDRRKLASRGTPEFRIVRRGIEQSDCIATFLNLEGMGWKGDEGSSLSSDANEAEFFRVMSSRFAAVPPKSAQSQG